MATLPQANKPVCADVHPADGCRVCAEVARRDEVLIDALQDAMVALTAVDGFDNWVIRSARAKASILEAMRLMQAKRW